MTYDTIVQHIRDAFREAPCPDNDALLPHHCPECHALRDALRGHTPDELADVWIHERFDQLVFMSPAAKRYFLPAYLRYAARQPDSTVAQFLLYSLSDSSRFEASRDYTTAQRASILEFLTFIEPRSDAEQRDLIANARDVWNAVT